MDFTLIKAIHIFAVMTAFLFFIIRAYPIVLEDHWNAKSSWKNKILVACHHSSYTALVLTGAFMVWYKYPDFPIWLIIKILCFVFLLIVSAIGFKRRREFAISIRQKALLIAFVMFFVIVLIAALKPFS